MSELTDEQFLKLLEPFDVEDDDADPIKDIEADIETAERERKDLILAEFPTFAWLDQEGLLPDGMGDDLRTDLRAMATILPGLQGGNAKQIAMMEAYRRGDMQTYDKLYAEVANANPKQ